MPKPRNDLEKVTLNLNKGDKDVLALFYPSVGWSVAARKIIALHCDRLREQEAENLEAPQIGEIKVPGIAAD